MKRILAITMTLAMLMSLMTVGASAVYDESSDNVEYNTEVEGYSENTGHGGGVQQNTNYSAGTVIGTSKIPVEVTVNQAGTTTHVYAVSIDVGELSYSYGSNTDTIWNPDTLSYDVVGDGDNWVNNTQKITVTNYSDLPVDVGASWQAATNHGNVTATVEVAAGYTGDGTSTLSLASALATGLETQNQARVGGFDVTMSGNIGGITATTMTVGTITLTIKVPEGD